VNHPHIISKRPNLHHNINLIDTRTVSIQHSPLRSELKNERSPNILQSNQHASRVATENTTSVAQAIRERASPKLMESMASTKRVEWE
jgi:hypothetical protein